MWKVVGAVALLCGALITALTPDSVLGQAAYLISFAGMTVAAWAAAFRAAAGRRTPWVLISAAVTSWLAGDVTWGILQLTHAETDVGLQDLFWLGGYPLLGAAMLSIVRRRGSGRGRAALQDGLTLSTAAAVAAWQFFIAPGLDGDGDPLAVLVGSLYPVGDVVLLAAVLYLLLSPGRTGVPGALLIAGTGLMLFMDTGITLVTSDWAAGDVDRLNGALLIANGLVVAPLLRRDRDLLTRPARAEVASLHPARLIFLGVAMLTAPITAVVQGAAPAGERFGLLAATVITVALCLARFTGAVREQARAQQSLIHLAGHDSLTGLANRRALSARLSGDIDGLFLLYIDLDGFKAVNDEHGHAAGDAVLIEVARRIRGQVRAGDLCARLGGDEFAVLCRDLDAAGARDLGERLGYALAEPIVADGPIVRVGASVGLADAADCADGDELLSLADHAMFTIKRSRRATVAA
ncbi:GGDEF domain-containing protein [Paractinoplanes globisporus]|uniref:GGDEF domain-containing protein n=1 Tax=Paractinoplanes globisporus TaxID=113565 RepID=A0ABW6W578_9ACTN|nr:GGDEF domain-containing protein [Actinoplanes globisporus]